MFRLIGPPRVVPINKAIVEKLQSCPKWRGDRSLNTTRLKDIAQRISEGRALAFHWAMATCQEMPGERFRVNGNHSSSALAAMAQIPAGMYATVEEYHCDTMHDLAVLFQQFDPRISVRSVKEQLNAFLRSHASLDGITPTGGTAIGAGIGVYNEYITSIGRTSVDQRGEMFSDPEVQKFCLWVNPIIVDKRWQRAAVVAVMYATWLKGPVEAMAFWKQAEEASHPNVDNPTRTLNRLVLIDLPSHKSRGSNEKKHWDDRAILVKCIHAWNAWCEGKTTDLKYFARSGIPEVYSPKSNVQLF